MLSVSEFCRRYGVSYLSTREELGQNKIDIEAFTDTLDAQGVSYFYASYCETDILEAFEAESHVNMDGYELIRLEGGLCLAI